MNCRAYFRVYEELNDYLPADKKKITFSLPLARPITVMEAIRSLDLPSEEVDLVLVNGESVGFDHLICDGAMVSIYPIFETLDISGFTRLRESPLIKLRGVQKKTG